MAAVAERTAFQFTEEMKGFIGFAARDFEGGYQKGKEEHSPLMFRLMIRAEDVDQFVESADHRARACGYIECDRLGGRRPVQEGEFNLFVDTEDLNSRKMRYRLFFADAEGNPITLTGVKRIQDNVGPDLWRDTTTLFTNLYRGHVQAEEEPGSTILATGILHIELLDFLKQLSTLRAYGPSFLGRASGLEKFSRFFLGSLWDVYGPAFLPRLDPFEREIPLYTTEGVADADVSIHPFSTGDKLGLSLLRFLREPCDDVVVIIHGLTTSSDMFIMPEHYNLVRYLHDQGFTDVWTLDFRMSNRFLYNLRKHRHTMDDIALYDYPAAFAKVRELVGDRKRVHVICHCLGSVSFLMSLAAGKVQGITSVISNSVSLTPRVPRWSYGKLWWGPLLAERIFGFEYINPYWRRQPGLSFAKIFAWLVSLYHRECNVPECHMLSFMWGTGFPSLYSHENLEDVTHRRGGDLYGGTSVHYYRHVRKMVGAGNRAVKYDPRNPRHKSLPDDYFAQAPGIETPILFTTGQKNNVFLDSNILCHDRLKREVPGRHQLQVFPNYGHQDVFMGKKVAEEVFPALVDFLKQHRAQH
jgi:cholesterol oxidase